MENKGAKSRKRKHEEERQPNGSGKRLHSSLFELAIGPEKQIILAHESVLCQSPVFSGLCNQNSIKKGTTQKLDLPDDSVKGITLLLDYLYSGVFRPLNVNHWERLIDETTDMYILADKYLVEGLKEAIVKELRAIGNTVNRPDLLFSSARKIYDHVFNSNDPFPTFFRENVSTIMSWEKLEPNTWNLILNIFSEGGKLAEDIFQAQRSTLLETQQKHEKLAGRTYCWKCTRPTIMKQKTPQSEPELIELIHVLD